MVDDKMKDDTIKRMFADCGINVQFVDATPKKYRCNICLTEYERIRRYTDCLRSCNVMVNAYMSGGISREEAIKRFRMERV